MTITKSNFFLFFLSLAVFAACTGASPPSNDEIRQLVATESIFSTHDTVSLDSVVVQTGTLEEKKYKARLTITFMCSRGGTWGNEGARDPIPNYSSVSRGQNTIQATAVFARYDDGKWHLERFGH